MVELYVRCRLTQPLQIHLALDSLTHDRTPLFWVEVLSACRTLALTCCGKPERRRSARCNQSGAAPCSARDMTGASDNLSRPPTAIRRASARLPPVWSLPPAGVCRHPTP